ncbi:putative proteasome inhibitor [Apostasia shenzhenica]|uniref:Putative proteasome inhibitor n=1 Tax=Apostasia shenzhenica TaxID=1088818 RepID=A0A2I0B333_9ASPA|nr:putative proteasome inhibitor [Apostasia shenzhenica]
MASASSVIAVIRASRPSFRNPHDKVAFANHASFLAAGFSLIAVGKAALVDNPPTEGEEVGIEGWNELDDVYGFLYSKSFDKGAKKVILAKCLKVEDYLMVDVAELQCEEPKEPIHLQINVKDYLAESSGQHSNYGEIYKNLESLVKRINKDLLSEVEGKAKVAASASVTSPSHDNIQKPGEKNEQESSSRFDVESNPMPYGLVYPPVVPFGSSDLYPGPGAGVFPERGSGIGGGMLVGPNDPRFFGGGIGSRPGFIDGIPGVPPGARFDPYGPPGVPGFEPTRFVRQPRRPGGGVHPDLEHFQGSDYI